MGRVLVTRPEPGAARTAGRLKERGFEAAILPLTEIRPLDIGNPPAADRYDAVAITSANALRHAPAEHMRAFAAKPCFTVGAASAEAARRAGFDAVIDGGGDMTALTRTLAKALPDGGRVLYLCGRVRSGDLAARLEPAGIATDLLETYDTVPVTIDDKAVLAAASDAPFRAVLVHSAMAGISLGEITGRGGGVATLFEAARFICISKRVAESLGDAGSAEIAVAKTPSENAMVALLPRAN